MREDRDDWSPVLDEAEAAKAPPPPPTSSTLYVNGNFNGKRDRAYALAGLRKECDALAVMPPDSGRNDTLNNAVYSMAGFIPTGILSEEEIVDSLTDAALASGLTVTETAATIKSALKGSRDKANIRVVPPPTRIPATPYVGPAASTANENANNGEAVADDTPLTLEGIEGDFWAARPELELIYTAALARMVSPWAVLACCVARILCLVPPALVLPPVIGGPGSLNWFAALAAKSGGGKGAAMTVARQLVGRDITVRPIGSGEGMIECYNRKPRKKNDDDEDASRPITSVLFDVAEVDSLGAVSNRTGQTTLAILRQGFSGETLGYSYRGRQSEQVTAHTYRMTLTVAVQPLRAGILLNDGGGGIPQRFMWFPARDKRITAYPPDWPEDGLGRPRVLPLISERETALTAGTIDIPAEVAQTIRDVHAASNRGEDNALDGHAVFCREKFAFALAYLDGRTAITTEDWELSGVAATVSDWMRTKSIEAYQAGLEDEARERGRLKGVESASSEVGKTREQVNRPQRVMNRIFSIIDKAGPEGISNRDLNRKVAYRDQDLFTGTIEYLMDQKRIRQMEGTTMWIVC